MPKAIFSEISVKAATITGAILGFLCWIAGAAVYAATGLGASFFHNGLISGVAGVVLGAIAGAAIGIVYNWALKMK